MKLAEEIEASPVMDGSSLSESLPFMLSSEKEATVAEEGSLSGIGLFTGEKVSLKILPAPPGSGIVFCRTDLAAAPEIPARLPFVREAPRCTRLATAKANLFMVEHLLSALFAFEIDNARIEVQGPEIPAGDGSALPFLALFEKCGTKKQEAPRTFIALDRPYFWSEGEAHLVALPSREFRVSYTLHYPHSPLLKTQYYSFSLTPEKYKAEIAPCRTFSLYEEILPFIEKGMIKGGGLENALVIRGEKILNPEGARFPDEMVRHKILDLIGDLALLGKPLLAHIIAIRSGHASNVAFAKVLSKSFNAESA